MLVVFVEGGKRSDDTAHYGHRMGIQVETLVKVLDLFVHDHLVITYEV